MSNLQLREVSHWEIWRRHNNWENPKFCYECLEDLDYEVRTTHRLAPVIHHVNGDHNDNRWVNLVSLHHGCHVRIHMMEGESQRRLASLDRTDPKYREAVKKAAVKRVSTEEGRASLVKAQAAAQSPEANEKRRESCRAAAVARYSK